IWNPILFQRLGSSFSPALAAQPVRDVGAELPGSDIVCGAELAVRPAGDHADDLIIGLPRACNAEWVPPWIRFGSQHCSARTWRRWAGIARPRFEALDRVLHRRYDLCVWIGRRLWSNRWRRLHHER